MVAKEQEATGGLAVKAREVEALMVARAAAESVD